MISFVAVSTGLLRISPRLSNDQFSPEVSGPSSTLLDPAPGHAPRMDHTEPGCSPEALPHSELALNACDVERSATPPSMPPSPAPRDAWSSGWQAPINTEAMARKRTR